MIHSFFLEVGLLDNHVARSIQCTLCCLYTDCLECVDHPVVYFIAELIQIDILILRSFTIQFTEYVNSIIGQHTCQFDVQTTLTDGQANLLRLQIYFSLALFFIESDAANMSRTQSTLDKQCGV